ncbi:MAG: hypothetical protein EXR77_05245 [Myxococcales bacterium]|nr:hypothetical protein [Myxococcales bacterium]
MNAGRAVATVPATGPWTAVASSHASPTGAATHASAAAALRLSHGVAFAVVEAPATDGWRDGTAQAVCREFVGAAAACAAQAGTSGQTPPTPFALLKVAWAAVADDCARTADPSALEPPPPTSASAEPASGPTVVGGAVCGIAYDDGRLALAVLGDVSVWQLEADGRWSLNEVHRTQLRDLRDQRTPNRTALVRTPRMTELALVSGIAILSSAVVRGSPQAGTSGQLPVATSAADVERAAWDLLSAAMARHLHHPESADSAALVFALRQNQASAVGSGVGWRLAASLVVGAALAVGALAGGQFAAVPLYPAAVAVPVACAPALAAPAGALPAAVPTPAPPVVAGGDDQLLPDCPAEPAVVRAAATGLPAGASIGLPGSASTTAPAPAAPPAASGATP